MNSQKYDHNQTETKWLTVWEKIGLFQDTSKQQIKSSADKMYLLFAFAYPSGAGLHVGHVESGTALDILARYWRMKGKQVFFPVGWDAFGLPAENYAIKTGVPPAVTTKKAIQTFRRQVKRLAISYDWATEVATSHPEYYKWTQWLFLQMYKKGLAYKKMGKVNWCPSCQTVLANEQVVEGKCERCGTEVVQKDLEQWYFKITDYTEELISGLEEVDWPKPTKEQQLHWIGKSEGVNIRFKIHDSRFKNELTCFTSRIDTVFGVTFVVVSPEKASEMMGAGWDAPKEVRDYVEQSSHKTEEERKVGEKDKSGVDTGLKAINPVNKEEVPVWVADYVLAEYGTGAVMGVPAHDMRDLAFAEKFGLAVKPVISAERDYFLSYLMGAEKITEEDLQALDIKILGKVNESTWKIEVPKKSISKYEELLTAKLTPGFWNEYVGDKVVFIFKYPDDRVERYELSGENEGKINQLCADFNHEEVDTRSPWHWLAVHDFYRRILLHHEYGRLINSGEFSGLTSQEAMDKIPETFAGEMEKAVEYKLRDWLISRQRYWGAPIPIVYDPEGKAHAVKEEHLPWLLPTDVEFKPTGKSPLTYSKEFKERVEKLYGKGWHPEYDTMDTFVDSSWYYLRYTDARNRQAFADKAALQKWMPVDFYMIGPEHIVLHLLYSRFFTKFLRDQGYLSINEPFAKMRHQGMILGPDHRKMSKSKGNVINPDEIVEKFGADTLRLYEMFMGPIETDKPWDPRAVQGMYRFLQRVWRMMMSGKYEGETTPKAVTQKLQETILKMGEEIEGLRFNTAIAALMELFNLWRDEGRIKREDMVTIVKLMAPLAPFMSEEMYQKLQNSGDKRQATSDPFGKLRASRRQEKGEKSQESVTGVLEANSKQQTAINEDAFESFRSVHNQSYPTVDKNQLMAKTVIVVVSVNGKPRGQLAIEPERWQHMADKKSEVTSQAKTDERVARWLEGKTIKREVWVEPKEGKHGMVNLVVEGE